MPIRYSSYFDNLSVYNVFITVWSETHQVKLGERIRHLKNISFKNYSPRVSTLYLNFLHRITITGQKDCTTDLFGQCIHNSLCFSFLHSSCTVVLLVETHIIWKLEHGIHPFLNEKLSFIFRAYCPQQLFKSWSLFYSFLHKITHWITHFWLFVGPINFLWMFFF